MRNLVVVLGDQLDDQSAAFDGYDPALDRIWMCEAPAEATYAWSHKARIAIFLSAMRHFRVALEARGWAVDYQATAEHPHATLADALAASIAVLKPRHLIVIEPGEWRLARDIERVCAAASLGFEVRGDRHFITTVAEFCDWMGARKQPRMEHFYRAVRQRTGVLMTADDEPEGGAWNYDHDNREAFGRQGPGFVPKPRRFLPDAITQDVLTLVAERYADHPGALEHFDWPVTRADALIALQDFIDQRLAAFGPFEDAVWDSEPLLYHSRLSAAMNLKLLNPREVIAAAVAAYHAKQAPIESVEGFVRQIIGWREYVRGLYWWHMPAYLDDNALGAEQPLPALYWTADTEMNCLHQAVRDTLAHGYAHHIQRLMITGLFALLFGVKPRAVHAWYLAVYVDAVEWVELPNTIGMSQFADGGLMGSKPYIASGKYIDRMSNYCAGCRYDPALSTGPKACPFTTLYWDFLDRHRQRFASHPRLVMQVRNLDRLKPEAIDAIRLQAAQLRKALAPKDVA
ncbi:cryptochrome/photolyase family protein [Nevskia ramosa]|uniref:cryptochrome/photolyase family protein n=1 Tax=Nevskia ramosa TaxID=64002 RepID=UPI00235310CA|nr:cryptochrome/photolyase family protein [Nevskia ramosa]